MEHQAASGAGAVDVLVQLGDSEGMFDTKFGGRPDVYPSQFQHVCRGLRMESLHPESP